MKVAVAPPILPYVPPHERPIAPVAAPPQPQADPLAFDRIIAFGENSEIDEAGVILVDLSVLAYKPLETVRRVLEKLGLSGTAISPRQDRGPDLEWLERQARARVVSDALAKWLDPKLAPKSAPVRVASPLEGIVAQQRTMVDIAILREPADATSESPTLLAAREKLAEVSKYDLVVVPASDEDLGRDFRNRPARVIGFRHGEHAYLAFRGTSSWSDVGRDLTAWPARRSPWRHKGFEMCWDEVRAHVQNWLRRETRALGHRPTLYIGGHSLGGAMATIAAIDLAALGYPIARVVTIGCPRAGGRGLRRTYCESAAAPGTDGAARNLAAVTTRFVHGTDAVTTVLPPPPIAVHVIGSNWLKAEDRVVVEDFVGSGNLFDTSALFTVLSGMGSPPTPAYLVGMVQQQRNDRQLRRNAATQLATWIAMSTPATWWARLLPFLPAIFEQARVSLFQHKSARYWDFLPWTALRFAIVEVAAEGKPKPPVRADGLHVVTSP